MTHAEIERRYSEFSRPQPLQGLDDAMAKFFEEVDQLRAKHGLPDVHIVVRMIAERDGAGVPCISSMHLGAVQEAEGMLAFAYARAGEERRHFLNRMKAQGMRARHPAESVKE